MDGSIPPPFHSCLADWQCDTSIPTYQHHIYIPSRTSWLSYTWWLVAADYLLVAQPCPICTEIPWRMCHLPTKQNQHSSNHSFTLTYKIHQVVSWPFQQLCCNLITDLPLFNGFDSLLIVVDHRLTKVVILYPTNKTVTAAWIASLFFHKVYLRFGLYDKIISNQGSQFASTFTKELRKILGYKLALSTAYHPQTNRETECINQEVKTYLHVYYIDNPTLWSDSISHAKFIHNH